MEELRIKDKFEKVKAFYDLINNSTHFIRTDVVETEGVGTNNQYKRTKVLFREITYGIEFELFVILHAHYIYLTPNNNQRVYNIFTSVEADYLSHKCPLDEFINIHSTQLKGSVDYAIANIRCVPQELGCDYDEKMYLLSKAFHNDASIEEHAQQMLYYLLFHLDIFASKLDYNYSEKQWVKKITNSATSN